MTTTKPPVLTDDERGLRLNQLINDFAIACAFGDDSAKRSAASFALREHFRAIEQAVLARAGADAVLVRLMPEVLASLKYHGQDVSLVADIERALKGTPAAAVADAKAAMLAHLRTKP